MSGIEETPKATVVKSAKRKKAATPRGAQSRPPITAAMVGGISESVDRKHDARITRLEADLAKVTGQLKTALSSAREAANASAFDPLTVPRDVQSHVRGSGGVFSGPLAAYAAALKQGTLPPVGITAQVTEFECDLAVSVPAGLSKIFIIGTNAADRGALVIGRTAGTTNGIANFQFLGRDLPTPDIAEATAAYYPLLTRLILALNEVSDKAGGQAQSHLFSELPTREALTNGADESQHLKQIFDRKTHLKRKSMVMTVPVAGISKFQSPVPVTGGQSAQRVAGIEWDFQSYTPTVVTDKAYEVEIPMNYDGRIKVQASIMLGAGQPANYARVRAWLVNQGAPGVTGHFLASMPFHTTEATTGGSTHLSCDLVTIIDPAELIDTNGNAIAYTTIAKLEIQLDAPSVMARRNVSCMLMEWQPQLHELTPIIELEGADEGAKLQITNKVSVSYDHTVGHKFKKQVLSGGSLPIEAHHAVQEYLLSEGAFNPGALALEDDEEEATASFLGALAPLAMQLAKPVLKAAGEAILPAIAGHVVGKVANATAPKKQMRAF